MDWITENWPWLAAMVGIIAKFANDHLMIKQHENRIDTLEDVMEEQAKLAATQTSDIKHIRTVVDMIAERQKTSESDIKNILRSDKDN